MIAEYLTKSDGRWIARLVYTEGGRRRERKRTLGRVHEGRGRPKAGAIPRREALRRLAEERRRLEADLARSRRDETDMTLRAIALAWLNDGGHPWKPSTAGRYRSILGQSRSGSSGHIIGPLGSLRVDELTEERMREWWASLGDLSPPTANKLLSTLRAIFAWAARDGRWGRIDDPTRHLRPRRSAPAPEETSAIARPQARARRRARSARPPDDIRARERATLIVVVAGVPLLAVFAAARTLPDALWFDELGQLGVFARIQLAKVALFVLAGGAAAAVLGLNVAVALRRADVPRTRPTAALATAASLITASFFASAAAGHWQTFLLWWHRQSFGVRDPMFGKDVAYFVFSLPLERAVVGFLLWLLAVAGLYAAVTYRAGGALSLRPLHATREAQEHLLALTAALLLVVAWRLRLERYMLELGQPSPANSRSFAGAGYVDTHVRSPLLAAGSVVAVVMALACLAAPRYARRAKLMVACRPGSRSRSQSAWRSRLRSWSVSSSRRVS